MSARWFCPIKHSHIVSLLHYWRRRVRLGVLIALLALSILSCGSWLNKAFEIQNAEALTRIKRIAIVNGISLVYNKKEKVYVYGPYPLSCTERIRQELVKELAKVKPDDLVLISDSTLHADLVDPFTIFSRKEAKMVYGSDPHEAIVALSLRTYDECLNCRQLADSLDVDAIWVIWGRWMTDVQDYSKVEYSKKEKGWLHVSGQIFSTSGELLAYTSITRTGIGFLIFVNYDRAYSMIANKVAKAFVKSLQPKSSLDENDL